MQIRVMLHINHIGQTEEGDAGGALESHHFEENTTGQGNRKNEYSYHIMMGQSQIFLIVPFQESCEFPEFGNFVLRTARQLQIVRRSSCRDL